MSLDSGGLARPSAVRLGGHDFAFVASLAPERDSAGAIREFSPQGRYAKADAMPLHKHGRGTFCRFRLDAPKGLSGVYALVIDGTVRYIGECEDLGRRFNAGYGNISPKNCYRGGQPTNCKINRLALDVTKVGGRVEVYFHPSSQRKAVEQQLIARYSPPWND